MEEVRHFKNEEAETIMQNLMQTKIVCINDARYMVQRLTSGIVYTPLVTPGSTVAAAHCTGKEFLTAKLD